MFYDRLTDIFKKDLITYSGSDDLEEIQSKLSDWERSGYLEILKPIKKCEMMEPCIRLLGPVPLPDILK